MKINLTLAAFVLLSFFLGVDAEVTIRNDTGKRVLIGKYGQAGGRALCSVDKTVTIEEQNRGIVVHYGSRRKKRVAHWVSLPTGAATVRLFVRESKDCRGYGVLEVLAEKSEG